MATSLPVEIYEILEDKLGREQAHDIVKAMEYAAGYTGDIPAALRYGTHTPGIRPSQVLRAGV